MKSKRILSLVLALVMVLGTFGTVFAEEPAEDVSDKIKWLQDQGIVEGISEDVEDLALGQNIDRASVAKMVVHALDKVQVAEGLRNYKAPFVDVPVTHWSNGNINVVSVEGLMIGNLKSQFMPSNEISYAEVLTVLVRIVMGEDLVNPVWPTSYIAKAHELGLMEGVAVPSDFMAASNRKDILEMFYNAMHKMQIGNYYIVKGIVLENNRVESISKDEVVIEIIREMQVADFAEASRKEKGDQERHIIDPKVGDVEDMLGKVYNFSLNKDNKVVSVELDESYTYVQAPINVSRTKVNSYTVELDERFRESDERIFRTYHNDKAYSYQDFYREFEKEDIDFAKLTVKNGKVLFIDAFTFDDIAPVESVRRDGLDVYVYNDYRDARLEKIEPRALVLGYNNGVFSRIEREDVKENDVVHVYDKNKMIVRLDAALTGEYEKVQRDRSNNYYAHIDGKGYLINDVDYRRPVYAHDSKTFTTLFARDASRELENFFREEVSILIDIKGDLQLFGADVEYNEGMAIVKQILARGQVKFVKRDNEEVILDEDFNSNISKYNLIDGTTTNQRLNEFNKQDLTFVLGDDNKIDTLVQIATAAQMRRDAKELKSGKSADMNNSFIRMNDEKRYQVLDRTNVFHIDESGAISASTVAKYQADLKDTDDEVKAYVLSDKDANRIFAAANVRDRHRITDEDNIAHTIVFIDLDLKAAATDGETVLATNVYTARTPHYVVGYGPDSHGRESIERTAAAGVSLRDLLPNDIVSLRLTKDDDKLVRSFDVLIPAAKVKTDSYRVVGGNLRYSANEYRRLVLEDAKGVEIEKWLVRGVEEFGTITIDSVVTFHEDRNNDIDVIRVYSRTTPVTANADAVPTRGMVTYVDSRRVQVDGRLYILDEFSHLVDEDGDTLAYGELIKDHLAVGEYVKVPVEVKDGVVVLLEKVTPGVPAPDKTALNAALLAADAKVEADYTAASWTLFQTALTSAKALPESTQAEVDAKLAAVNAAIDLLVPVTPPATGTLTAVYESQIAGKKWTFNLPAGETTITSATVNGVATTDFVASGGVGQIRVNAKTDVVKVVIGGTVYTLVE